jgi:catechol 2,3-dioxygenase-like lactoylglutathione lyase family enzyme
MVARVEKVSAVTFQVRNMQVSVHFYRDVLGMELIYGGEDSYFSSLRASEAESAILNLQKRSSWRALGSVDPVCDRC